MTLIQDLAAACAGTYSGAAPMWEDKDRLVHAYLSEVNGHPCVAWRGTSSFQEWIVDFMALEVPTVADLWAGPVHMGLQHDVESVGPAIYATLLKMGLPPYYNTGHSKGAGEAILFHAYMKSRGYPPIFTMAFEPPQVGGHMLRDYLSEEAVTWSATVNKHGRDLVTQVPFGPTWSHINDPLLLTVSDDYDIPTKHRIPAVIEALAAASGS